MGKLHGSVRLYSGRGVKWLNNYGRPINGYYDSGKPQLYYCSDIGWEGSVYFFRKPKLSIILDRNDPNNYAPVLELVTQDGQLSGIKRKFLKIRVVNRGRAVAHNCTGEFHVISGESRHPSDTKFLCWHNQNSRSINIGINRGEYLHVIFADSNFPSLYERNGLDIYALSSTPESLYRLPKVTLAQDAFGVGDFVIELKVECDEGVIETKRLTLHVDKDNTQSNIDVITNDEVGKWTMIKAKLWR